MSGNDRTGAAGTSPVAVESHTWERVQRLYAFCRARAIERVVVASEDTIGMRKQRRELHVLESMYGKARQHGDVVIGCAVTYFRAQALKDANHPDFLGEWI
jgi:hypothetical protein